MGQIFLVVQAPFTQITANFRLAGGSRVAIDGVIYNSYSTASAADNVIQIVGTGSQHPWTRWLCRELSFDARLFQSQFALSTSHQENVSVVRYCYAGPSPPRVDSLWQSLRVLRFGVLKSFALWPLLPSHSCSSTDMVHCVFDQHVFTLMIRKVVISSAPALYPGEGGYVSCALLYISHHRYFRYDIRKEKGSLRYVGRHEHWDFRQASRNTMPVVFRTILGIGYSIDVLTSMCHTTRQRRCLRTMLRC